MYILGIGIETTSWLCKIAKWSCCHGSVVFSMPLSWAISVTWQGIFTGSRSVWKRERLARRKDGVGRFKTEDWWEQQCSPDSFAVWTFVASGWEWTTSYKRCASLHMSSVQHNFGPLTQNCWSDISKEEETPLLPLSCLFYAWCHWAAFCLLWWAFFINLLISVFCVCTDMFHIQILQISIT